MGNMPNSYGLSSVFGNETTPIPLFKAWLEEAKLNEVNDPSAFALATVDISGQPSVRMLLLKGVVENGFVFYTNMNSRKAKDLQVNPKASICFHWKSLQRQVRVSGSISRVSEEEADKYFESRDHASKVGAWASLQSSPMEQRSEFEKRISDFQAKYPEGSIVPRPPHWSGWILSPEEVEFWLSGASRLHERLVYKIQADATWSQCLLYP